MADIVTTSTAALATGINMTSITNAAMSGRLDYTTPTGDLLVSLAAVKRLAAASGIRTT